VPPVAELVIPDPVERDDLGAFVARAVRLDQGSVIRLKMRRFDSVDRVDAWASTPFDTLATRSVTGSVVPADLTVAGPELLAALAIVGKDRVDPGAPRDPLWRSPLPPTDGWRHVEQVPASVLNELAEQGTRLAREHAGPHGSPPAALLDQTVLTVSDGGDQVKIPLRCLFALAGMGLIASAGTEEPVKISATSSWLRIDARYGAVVRRRHAQLPLLVDNS
jgi:hypothetical protein